VCVYSITRMLSLTLLPSLCYSHTYACMLVISRSLCSLVGAVVVGHLKESHISNYYLSIENKYENYFSIILIFKTSNIVT